jgi:hypothetical protein
MIEYSTLEQKLLKKLASKPATTTSLAKALYPKNPPQYARATVLTTARRLSTKLKKSKDKRKLQIGKRSGPKPVTLSLSM